MKKILLLFVCLFVCWVLSAQQRIKVACVGNSITYGTGLSDRATQSYPVKLQKLLGERYEVENFGKPGATLLNQGHRPYTRQEEYRKAAVDAVRKLASDVGIPKDLKGIAKEEDVRFLSESAVADACAPGNPKEATLEDIEMLYRKLL